MASGTNNNGYETALDRFFSNSESHVPTRSALSQYRQTISWKYFADLHKRAVQQWQEHAPRWKGYRVQGIDGDRLTLPATEEILEAGYRGTPTKDGKETYYPTMYYCAAIDLLSGVSLGLAHSTQNDEIGAALELLRGSDEKRVITILDRLYISGRLLDYYGDNQDQFFICRVKSGSTFKEIVDFMNSGSASAVVTIQDVKMRLVKAVHDGGEEIAIATNLPKKISDAQAIRLYAERWDCETANRDRTQSMKIEQFRSKKLNGVLQEIYVALLIETVSKAQIALEIEPHKYFLKEEYQTSNLKALVIKIGDCIGSIIDKPSMALFKAISNFIHRNKAKRKHFSRSYERINRKILGKLYQHESLIPRRG